MKKLITFARILRKQQTFEEVLLWMRLRDRGLGMKFRRQYPIGCYILDFYCPEKKLAIELDGKYHFTSEGVFYDEERSMFLREEGIEIMRFENIRIRTDIENVLKEIQLKLK